MKRNTSMAAGPSAAQRFLFEPDHVDSSQLPKHSRAMMQVNTCDYLVDSGGGARSASTHPMVYRSDDVEDEAGQTVDTRMIPACLPINISHENVRMPCFLLCGLAVLQS